MEQTKQLMEEYCVAFLAHLPEMLKHHRGKWAVFGGTQPMNGSLGFYDTNETAFNEGLRAYGNVPMYIHQVSDEYPDHPIIITRLISTR